MTGVETSFDGMTQLAVSGASGKTGWRVVDEALKRGQSVRAIVRPASVLPPALAQAEQEGRLDVRRLELVEDVVREVHKTNYVDTHLRAQRNLRLERHACGNGKTVPTPASSPISN